MAQVQVDQAVFTSSASGPVQGYQLVARSPGIDERVAHMLRQWSPTHNGLASTDRNASSINFFPVDKNRIAIGRTVYGLSEYSSRGSLQTLTIYLVASNDHLLNYDGDAWVMASIARSIGLLRFDRDISANLPAVRIPERTILGGVPYPNCDQEVVDRTLELLERGRQVAIVGVDNPISILRQAICQMSIDQRMVTSFATGLSHSSQRKFQIEFHQSSDTDLRYELSQNDVSIVQPEKRAKAFYDTTICH